jgi:hypothetical protein
MIWARKHRVTGKPTKKEVNLRAIPLLPRGGWRLIGAPDIALTGAAPKHYLAYGDVNRADCEAYFAKKGSRVGGAYRDVVTEEMISKIGQRLPVRMARSRLVRLPEPPGRPPDVRFMSRNFVRPGESLLMHGLEIVAEYLDSRADEIHRVFNLDESQAEHRFYTVHSMVEVLRWFCRDDDEERASILDSFARMLAFDALVGAPDRHAMNWGVLVPLAVGSGRKEFAPLFDTARGMFRELTDATLAQVDRDGRRENFIQAYARKSRPVFGVGEVGPARCNHFDLIGCALDKFPDELGRPIRKFVRGVHIPTVATALRRSFRKIVSARRLSFIADLLTYRHSELRRLVEESTRP